jgi:hypothetical protein
MIEHRPIEDMSSPEITVIAKARNPCVGGSVPGRPGHGVILILRVGPSSVDGLTAVAMPGGSSRRKPSAGHISTSSGAFDKSALLPLLAGKSGASAREFDGQTGIARAGVIPSKGKMYRRA